MFKPVIKIEKDKKGFFHYFCRGLLGNNESKNCYNCDDINICEVDSNKFAIFYAYNRKCCNCLDPLDKLYIYTIFRIREYIPKDFKFLCCMCYYKERVLEEFKAMADI